MSRSPQVLARGVRRAERRDLNALCEIWIEITRHHEPLDPLYTLRSGAREEIRALLRGWLRDPDAAAFVCERDGAIAGMSCVRIEYVPPILEECQRAEITDLGVRSALRRQGIGRALVETALGWVRERGVERIEVRVAAGNVEGQAFWRGLGFGDHVNVLHLRPSQ